MLFALLFTGTVMLIARPALKRTSILVFVMGAWFVIVREPTDLFFELHYESMAFKFLVYVMIVTVPVLLFTIFGARSGYRLALAVTICYLALLPFTRPTLPFLKILYGWKLSHLQDRFLENLSRVRPDKHDVSILKSSCDSISGRARTFFIAHLRSHPVSENSNACLQMARRWDGPHPGPVVTVQRTRREWRALYELGTPDARIKILEQLRINKNPSLKREAVAELSSSSDPLLIAAVRYLQEISGKQIGYDAARWNEWLAREPRRVFGTRGRPKQNSPLVERGFSAIQVLDDLILSKQEGKDFLETYLQKHFPATVSDQDIAMLREACKEAESRSESIANFYRKGMMYFFLALAESARLQSENIQDASAVSDHWKIALENLHSSGMTGYDLALEVNQIINRADQDRNGELNQQELRSILATRSR